MDEGGGGEVLWITGFDGGEQNIGIEGESSQAANRFVVCGDLPQLLERDSQATPIDLWQLPLAARCGICREAGHEKLDAAPGNLGQGEFALLRESLGALVELVRQLNLSPRHDEIPTSLVRVFNFTVICWGWSASQRPDPIQLRQSELAPTVSARCSRDSKWKRFSISRHEIFLKRAPKP
jgi:hypothetical protein